MLKVEILITKCLLSFSIFNCYFLLSSLHIGADTSFLIFSLEFQKCLFYISNMSLFYLNTIILNHIDICIICLLKQEFVIYLCYLLLYLLFCLQWEFLFLRHSMHVKIISKYFLILKLFIVSEFSYYIFQIFFINIFH